ncbi:MAG: serine--tRNA ligase [Candidatus Nomurabacteria bacterium]|jgi:seryl-tRNA synthetase|nr:serine--tRNA ligase [Candidatus Nomurabacteria bacterium]
MLDIKFVRENAEKVQKDSDNKGYDVDVNGVLKLDEQRRELQGKTDELRAQRNETAAKMKNGRPSPDLIAEGKKLKEKLSGLEEKLRAVDDEFVTNLKKIPNTPCDDVPIGQSEDENVVAEVVGQSTKFDFAPKNHWEIGQLRGWIDKERAAKVTGARFAYIQSDLVKLELAIEQLVIDVLTDEAKLKEIIKDASLKNLSAKPFTPILPPLMVRTEVYDAMDRLEPREDRYKIEGEELWLQGSAEHVLGSMYMDEIIDEKDLPVRMVGFATSFRKEAGAAGKDMEGILRMHQFDKLELEALTTAENSFDEHQFFIAIQRYLIEQLELPYRVVMKCTADIGKPNARGVDMEVWLAGQNKYRETHSADYMTDYQARRLATRVRRTSGEIELVHTNDATAFALGRIMIAIIENYQNEDGSVRMPKVLQKYMGGKEKI